MRVHRTSRCAFTVGTAPDSPGAPPPTVSGCRSPPEARQCPYSTRCPGIGKTQQGRIHNCQRLVIVPTGCMVPDGSLQPGIIGHPAREGAPGESMADSFVFAAPGGGHREGFTWRDGAHPRSREGVTVPSRPFEESAIRIGLIRKLKQIGSFSKNRHPS